MNKPRWHFLRKTGACANSFSAATILLTQDGLDRSYQAGALPSEHRWLQERCNDFSKNGSYRLIYLNAKSPWSGTLERTGRIRR